MRIHRGDKFRSSAHQCNVIGGQYISGPFNPPPDIDIKRFTVFIESLTVKREGFRWDDAAIAPVDLKHCFDLLHAKTCCPSPGTQNLLHRRFESIRNRLFQLRERGPLDNSNP